MKCETCSADDSLSDNVRMAAISFFDCPYNYICMSCYEKWVNHLGAEHFEFFKMNRRLEIMTQACMSGRQEIIDAAFKMVDEFIELEKMLHDKFKEWLDDQGDTI